MAQLAQKMVKEALDAYVREDVDLAKRMAQDDDQVDSLHNQVFRELLVFSTWWTPRPSPRPPTCCLSAGTWSGSLITPPILVRMSSTW